MPRLGTSVAAMVWLLALWGMLATVHGCTRAEAHNPFNGWTRIRLDAEAGPVFGGHVEMQLDEQAGKQRLTTLARARILGVRVADARTLSVFDRRTGKSDEHTSYSRTKGRRFRFADDGYTVEELYSPSGVDGPPEDWQVTGRQEFGNPAPGGDTTSAVLLDYYSMLIYLREVELEEPGDEVTLAVATPDGPRTYRVSVAESRLERRTYTDLNTDDERTVEVQAIRLQISPADPREEDAGFLHMEGETQIWVEARSKTPLEISGRVPKVGGVKLRLTRMG